MVKRAGSKRVVEPQSEWTEQLSAAINAVALLTAPPLGTNARLGNLLKRLGLAVAELKNLSEQEFLRELEALADRSTRTTKRSERSLQGLQELSLADVERRINDPSTSKADLLAIIRARFGGATGTLTRLPKAAIAERLQTLVMNERGHDAISRVASLSTMSSIPVEPDPINRPREQDEGTNENVRPPRKE